VSRTGLAEGEAPWDVDPARWRRASRGRWRVSAEASAGSLLRRAERDQGARLHVRGRGAVLAAGLRPTPPLRDKPDMLRNLPSTTAEAVCLMRAHEHTQPRGRRVVDDPYAQWFLRPLARAAIASEGALPDLGRYADWATDGMLQFVLGRHRYMDDALERALRGGVEQVVVLGAGYDMRAYRLAEALGERPLFEVDHPATSRRKVQILARHAAELPPARVQRVEVDFETQSFRDELRKAGFRERRKTFFVWEGVSMYLTRAAVKHTLETMRAMSAPGSGVVLDLWYLQDDHDLRAAARRFSSNLLALLGEPVTFPLHPEDAAPFFERLGFRLREIADAGVLRQRYFSARTHIYPTNYVALATVEPRRGRSPRRG
jgi:methyltransferase (TIGR00027 family)